MKDLGNTNFSVHLSREAWDRNVVSQVICNAVRSFGINAEVNHRNDICVGDVKMSII
jgi:lipoate-protein ligase A